MVLQDARRGHRTSREHHPVRPIVAGIAADHALDHLGRARLVQQRDHLFPGHQREVRQCAIRIDQVALGVRLVAGDRGIAVEVLGLLLVLQDLGLEPERQRLRAPARAVADDPVDQPLQLGLVVEAVDVQQTLGLVVVRRDLGEPERPGEALVLRVGLELVRREAEQRGAVPFGLAADVVVLVGHQKAAMAILPGLAVLELALLEHLPGVERAAVLWQMPALLEHQHAPPGLRQPVAGGGAARARADDDHVVSFAGHRLVSRSQRPDGARAVAAMEDAAVMAVVVELGADHLGRAPERPVDLDRQQHAERPARRSRAKARSTAGRAAPRRRSAPGSCSCPRPAPRA